MHPLLNGDSAVRITQSAGRLTGSMLEPVDLLVLVTPERMSASEWRRLPQGARLQAAAKRRRKPRLPFTGRLNNKKNTLVVGGNIAAGATAFEMLTLGRRLIAAATAERAGCLGICVHGFDDDASISIARHVVSAALAASAQMPSYRRKVVKPAIRRIRLVGLPDRIDLSREEAEAEGNHLARWLTAMPPNKLDAGSYADIAKSLAADNGWQYKRYGTKELAKLGAGAFLAVAQGNDDDSACIVRLRYRPAAKSAKPDISLVGKGIIFDTGGTNLKPFESMLHMHGDMQGSAVALGTLLMISRLGLDCAVDCWLAITENRTGPRAYKSQDVVTAANGKTIQTIHTDAEGRMALADTLVFACRDKPKLVIDYATLTGACVNAVTSRYSGVFTNRPDWHERLTRAGAASGERIWPFPIGREFLSDLRSTVADIKQCAIKGYGDHILAGSFLAEFVDRKTPWLHIDLSASDHEGGLAHVPTKVTGFGVRLSARLLIDEDLAGLSEQ